MSDSALARRLLLCPRPPDRPSSPPACPPPCNTSAAGCYRRHLHDNLLVRCAVTYAKLSKFRLGHASKSQMLRCCARTQADILAAVLAGVGCLLQRILCQRATDRGRCVSWPVRRGSCHEWRRGRSRWLHGASRRWSLRIQVWLRGPPHVRLRRQQQTLRQRRAAHARAYSHVARPLRAARRHGFHSVAAIACALQWQAPPCVICQHTRRQR